ncbi:glyoxylate/hydroxypyruvate reductase A [Limimonas halophila]|uniref:Glyoxylate/hydroxypyruvate reductase A n=1 Tax=Limimonas halophila TaxID=1082479 RepID=A0A1G7KVG5_9PROT|nr:glyoxylate/hydroxypyruvate reductase A [Limimonas halophila]SDF41205.1 glyoxylate/hydroxypyruvate reductase A [Limimonas halophila]
MSFLVQSIDGDAEQWRSLLHAALPDHTIRVYPDDLDDPASVRHALVWQPPAGLLASLPNLEAIFSMGAGVDHILRDPELPADVPIVRLADAGLRQGMVEYVTLAVLRHHRALRGYIEQQAQRRWAEIPVPLAGGRRVGILGLGELGQACATALAGLGFDVAGWARTPKQVPGVTTHAGTDGLETLLARSDILVCLLPLTDATRGILNRTTLEKLPPGACVVNVARGQHLVQPDLLALLDSGHLAGATLDVTDPEPLPAADPLWAHPRVLVTPHVAAPTKPESAVPEIAGNVRRLARGEPPAPIVNRNTGY